MDQCVCTKQNDQSRYAGVRESLKSSDTGALCSNFSLFNNAQACDVLVPQRITEQAFVRCRTSALNLALVRSVPFPQHEAHSTRSLRESGEGHARKHHLGRKDLRAIDLIVGVVTSVVARAYPGGEFRPELGTEGSPAWFNYVMGARTLVIET